MFFSFCYFLKNNKARVALFNCFHMVIYVACGALAQTIDATRPAFTELAEFIRHLLLVFAVSLRQKSLMGNPPVLLRLCSPLPLLHLYSCLYT